MSNSSPPDPSPLKFDNCLAVFVALTTINSLLYYWALHKQNDRFSLKKLRYSPPTPQPNSASEALATLKPTPNAPESMDFGFDPINFSKSKSPNPKIVRSSSALTNISLGQRLSKPHAPEENTALASAPDSAVSTPIATAPTPIPVVEFSDVPDNSWASRSIKSLNKRHIIAGKPDRSFGPNKFATRGEFAVLLQKIFEFGKENKTSTIDFKDLPANYWASDAIKKVSTTGILKGYPAGDFRPDQPITRAEVLVALATALKLKTPSTPAKTLQVYKDADQVLDYAIAKVAAAQEAGLVVGYPKESLLVPNKPATRAEMATMLYHALAKSGQEQKVSTRLSSSRI